MYPNSNQLSFQTSGETLITGWDEDISMPQTFNSRQLKTANAKALRPLNKKQFVQRRWKHDNKENLDQNNQLDSQRSSRQMVGKDKSINYQLSSINQLKNQMRNIQKMKDRWTQEGLQYKPRGKLTSFVKRPDSGSIKLRQNAPEGMSQDLESSQILKSINICKLMRRSNSNSRQGNQKMISLSERSNEGSMTIHNRYSNRPLSSKCSKKLKAQQNISFTINQIESLKAKEIFKILCENI